MGADVKFGHGLVVAAAVVVIGAGLRVAQPVVAPLMLAVFIAIVTAPVVTMLNRHGVPKAAAVTVVMMVVLAGLSGLALVVAQSVVGIEDRLPRYAELFDALLGNLAQRLAGYGVDRSDVDSLFPIESVLGLARQLAQGFAGAVAVLSMVLVVVAFMLLEAGGLHRKLARMIEHPTELERIQKVVFEIRRYLAVKLATSAATGLLTGVWVALLGLDFPILWGLLAFLLNFIPNIGSIVAALPPVALALVQQGPGVSALVALGYLVVNFGIGNIIEPRVMGRALGLSPLVVLLCVFFWGWLLGPVGALVSVPLTTIAKITFAASARLQWLAVMLGPPEAAAPK